MTQTKPNPHTVGYTKEIHIGLEVKGKSQKSRLMGKMHRESSKVKRQCMPFMSVITKQSINQPHVGNPGTVIYQIPVHEDIINMR